MATSSVFPDMSKATAPMSLPGGTNTPPVTPPSNMVAAATPMSIPGLAPTPSATTAKPLYSMDAVPQFLRDTLDMTKVKIGGMDPNAVKNATTYTGPTGKPLADYVSSDDPYTIHSDPNIPLRQSLLNHELTHTYQDISGAQFAPADPKDPYNYGGVQGLLDAQAKGKKINDFSNEQVARMIQDHTERTSALKTYAAQGVLQPEDVAAYQKWKSAVGPYVTQLAALKGKKYAAQPEKPGTISDLPEFSNDTIPVPAAKPLF